MSNETVMLLSAGIATGISLLTFALTRIFDAFSEKRKEKERFFYEIYSLRLSLYQKILKQIHLFFDNTYSGTISSPTTVANITEKFIDFSNRGVSVASPAVYGNLQLISNFITNDIVIGKRLSRDADIEPFISFMIKNLKFLRSQIREETCPTIVDEFLFILTRTKTTHKTSKEKN